MYLVSKETLQNLLNYLIQRPYHEVHEHVNAIRGVKPLEQPPENPQPTTTQEPPQS